MKTIGLIGGMSWESSKTYYEILNREIAKRLGGSHSADVLMHSVDFAEIERLSFSNEWDTIGKLMAESTNKLERGGADLIILCTNTIHLVADHITNTTKLPFIHIAHATGEAIKAKGITKIGLLGTRFTMERDFYTGELAEKFAIETIIPSEDSRQKIHDIIYQELVKGIFREESLHVCLEAIDELTEQGAQGIILGCTELPLIIKPEHVSVPTFDTTSIHANKALDHALV